MPSHNMHDINIMFETKLKWSIGGYIMSSCSKEIVQSRELYGTRFCKLVFVMNSAKHVRCMDTSFVRPKRQVTKNTSPVSLPWTENTPKQ